MPNFNPVAAAALFHEREVRLTTLPGAVVRASVPGHECLVVKEPPYGASESFSLSVRDPGSFIDHFHKWRPIINSFANIKISLTNLILKLIIQKSFYSETRLVRLI